MQDALVSECEKATERESCTGFPWILAPYELVSWWDMKPFPIVRIVQFIRSFEQGASDSLGSELPVASSPEEIKLIKKDTQGIAEQCKEWGFVLTADQFERISESIKENTKNAAILPLVTVRRAWRNPTMHVEKTYTSERAEEILIAVRSFMRHLAGRLHD